MDSMTRYLAVWVSGVATGLVLGERWRRAAARPAPAVDDGGEPLAAVSPTSAAGAENPKMTAWVIAGVKGDARRVRAALDRVIPGSARSPVPIAQLHRVQAPPREP